jgi:hypothetical protein
MGKWLGLLVAVAVAGGIAEAGEIVLKSGQRLVGDLADHVLLLSTGSDIVEVASADIAVLTPDTVRLLDGRILRGTLVGERLRARTVYGELAIKLDDLQAFRAVEEAARNPVPQEAPARAAPAPTEASGGAATETAVASSGPAQVAEGGRRVGQGLGDVASGVGRTVGDGADRIHDGFKAVGLAIWERMKSVGRAVENAFTGAIP